MALNELEPQAARVQPASLVLWQVPEAVAMVLVLQGWLELWIC